MIPKTSIVHFAFLDVTLRRTASSRFLTLSCTACQPGGCGAITVF